MSEELVWGCEPAALESESSPCCPPGPVVICRAASASMVRKTMSGSLRLSRRIASFKVFPRAFVRSKKARPSVGLRSCTVAMMCSTRLI